MPQPTYRRPDYVQHDEDQIFSCIERNSFATLVSNGVGSPVVSHLPLLLDRENRRLIGHMARANGHWEEASLQEVLCIFNGPHAYVSPRWYAERNVVPTWNYVVVHVRGRMNILEDEQATLEILRQYVQHFEANLPEPWSVGEPDEDFIRKLSRQTVAFEISIEKLDGIWKLSQHHDAERRAKVVSALEKQSCENAQSIAELMR